MTNHHRLSDVDLETKSATCDVCGPTLVYFRPGRSAASCIETERRRWRADRLRKYGLTEGQYAALPGADGTCPICQRSGLVMYIDHDHACCPGKGSCGRCVRGVLCADCNLSLGRFRDEVATMRRAIAYLQAG
jgi:hypothetical protein